MHSKQMQNDQKHSRSTSWNRTTPPCSSMSAVWRTSCIAE